MAHSDIFIFLNSITWIFFSFFAVYLFLVLFFIPSVYKKMRFRSWFSFYLFWTVFLKVTDFLSVCVSASDHVKLLFSNLILFFPSIVTRKYNFFTFNSVILISFSVNSNLCVELEFLKKIAIIENNKVNIISSN